METFKIENFKKANQEASFPKHASLTSIEARKIQDRLSRKLGIVGDEDGLALVLAVEFRGEWCEGVDAEDKKFSLRRTLAGKGINSSERVYINWYRYDVIDVLALDELDRYFTDVWYPDADDIDIFDDSLEWILSVTHTGKIRLLKM